MNNTTSRYQVSIEADPNVPIIHITRDFDATTAQLERMLSVRMKKRTRAMILLAAYQGRTAEASRLIAADARLAGGAAHAVAARQLKKRASPQR